MPARPELQFDAQTAPLLFRSPRNWTGVIFFGALAAFHLGMAATSVPTYPMSLVFGAMFASIALACFLIRHEIVFLPDRRRMLVRTGFRGIGLERSIPFSSVSSVRVTLLGAGLSESSVWVVCEQDDIELPPSGTPRQQALLLAMILGVRLVKVYGDGPPPEPAQRIESLYRNEDAI